VAKDKYEVVRRDEPNHRQTRVGKVVATHSSGDRAREIQRQLHGERQPGDSHWYEVRETE
jgi:hypothetical protein